MSVRERLLALSLLEKQEKNPQYAKEIGLEVTVETKHNESPICLDKNSDRKEGA